MSATDTRQFMAMKGAGYYSRATVGARDAINLAVPLITGAIDRMHLANDGRVVRVADIGCADGGTSLGMWTEVLGHIRRSAPSRPIEIVYTDLPRNDFSQLFRTVHGQTEAETYYGRIPDVHPFASGTSFHQAIFPPASLHLAFSATASHYITKAPVDIPDHVHMVGASGDIRRAWEETGRAEWESMMAQRARELAKGGRLVFLNFGIDSKGRYLGHTGGVSMFDTFDRLWKELAREGRITDTEYRGTNFPQVYRTADQFTEPFRNPASPVHRSGMRIEHVEERHLVCPFAKAFLDHRDPVRFAREYIPTLRSWSEPTFAGGLAADRTPADRTAILDDFYGRYERLVATAPDGHGMDYIHIHLIAEKE